jgi:hypothetical protein
MKKNILLVPGAVFVMIAAGLGIATSTANAADKCYRTVVVQPATIETINHPAVTEEVMTDPGQPFIAPTAPTEGHYENLQWYVYTGNVADGTLPAREDPNFMPVPALPSGLPHEPVIGVVYNVSHGEAGLGSHFKYDGDFVEGTPGDPGQPFIAPTFEIIEVDAAWVEKIKHPAVTDQERVPCENPPEVEGEQETPPEVAGVQLRAPRQAPIRPAAPAAELPTAVDAGL